MKRNMHDDDDDDDEAYQLGLPFQLLYIDLILKKKINICSFLYYLFMKNELIH